MSHVQRYWGRAHFSTPTLSFCAPNNDWVCSIVSLTGTYQPINCGPWEVTYISYYKTISQLLSISASLIAWNNFKHVPDLIIQYDIMLLIKAALSFLWAHHLVHTVLFYRKNAASLLTALWSSGETQSLKPQLFSQHLCSDQHSES